MQNIRWFAAFGAVAAGLVAAPIVASAQGTVVRRDTIVSVRKDTVVHTHKDTAIVTTRVSSSRIPPSGTSIASTLERLPNYKTLVSLLDQAHLMPTLRSAAPVTIFAPTDEAFSRVDPAALAEVRANPARLRKFLLNMIVSGKIDTREILKLKTAKNLQGTRIRFTYSNGIPKVNDQPVVQPGILASNGFIYGLGGVLGLGGM